MSVILQTRDNKIYVVPRTLLAYWEVFSSLEEAIGINDDIIPIPLTSGQTDIWLDLTLRIHSDWLILAKSQIDTLPCLEKKNVELVVRIMDPKDNRWYLYCHIGEDETEEELKRWLLAVGKLHIVEEKDREEWESDWCSCLFRDVICDYEDGHMEDNDIVVFGILHNDLLKHSGNSTTFSWMNISWNTIIKFNLSSVITNATNSDARETPNGIDQNVLLLCYDGVHTPIVAHPVCFTSHIPSLVETGEINGDIRELYLRTMRCAIATMEKYPEYISSIGEELLLCGGKIYESNNVHIDISRRINRIHTYDRTALENKVGEEGVQLYKKAKMMYLDYETKKCVEL